MRVLKTSIFDSECGYITNTVNTVGVMGAGLALEFRLRVPEMYRMYRDKCDRGEIQIGKYWIYDKPNRTGKKILNFPTKRNFNQPSQLDYLSEGLEFFAENYQKDQISSIAFPILGSHLGKISQNTALAMMEQYLENLPLRLEIYANYYPDNLTKWVKEQIQAMSQSEISAELGITPTEAEKVKSTVRYAHLLSDLVTFKKISFATVQALYDFGFTKSPNLKLTSLA